MIISYCSTRLNSFFLSSFFLASGFGVEPQTQLGVRSLASEDFTSFESISSSSSEQQEDFCPKIFLKKLVFHGFFSFLISG
jgi:hypothetical protein